MELTRGSAADLIGREVVGEDSKRVGRVVEIRVAPQSQDGGPPEVLALLVGSRALWQRLRGTGHEAPPVPWSSVVRLEPGRIVVRVA